MSGVSNGGSVRGLNWDALYMSAEPENPEEVWRWLQILMFESPSSFTDYENTKRLARAQDLFVWLEEHA